MSTANTTSYEKFIAAKILATPDQGIVINPADVSPILKPHQRDIVVWAVRRGRTAIFAAFGLGKTLMQLEIARLLQRSTGGRFLIVAPLGVRQEFLHDATMLNLSIRYVRSIEECPDPGIYITNYETIRDGKLDPRQFVGVCLDEAACFPPDTQIETPKGLVPLNSLRIGDTILNASGVDSISDIFKTAIRRAVRITTRAKKSILSSDNHPYFTHRGWVEAAELRPGDTLVETPEAMRMVRSHPHSEDFTGSTQAFLRSILLGEMDPIAARDCGAYASDENSSTSHQRESASQVASAATLRTLRRRVSSQVQLATCAAILREPMLGKVANVESRAESSYGSDVPHSRGAEEAQRRSVGVLGQAYAGERRAKGSTAKQWTPREAGEYRKDEAVFERPNVFSARRKRGFDGAPVEAIEGSWGASDGVPDYDRASRFKIQVSTKLLQGGHCIPSFEGCGGSGRQYAQAKEVEVSGPTQDGSSERARVDSVEILELGHPDLDRYRDADGIVYFYDLTATRHPSFSVDGYLVHNCLRGFGGTKTFRTMMGYFEGSGLYRFVATATPSPNDYIEMLAYAAFLDILDVSQGKTRFFKRDSTHADELTLLPHKAQEFWLWISTWAIFLQKPSDLGYDDAGYTLPAMTVNWHELASDHENSGMEPSGQGRLLRNSAIGLSAAAREKRDSLDIRVEKARDLAREQRRLASVEQFVVWCELNREQEAIDKMLDAEGISYSSLYGKQDIDEREVNLAKWKRGETAAFVSKAAMYGAGVNLQQCNRAIFLGVGYKFFQFIQAIHRIFRFLQTRPVTIDIIYTEAEREIRRELERKWEQHKELIEQMSEIIRTYGLATNALQIAMSRSSTVEREEVSGKNFRLIHNDCVLETAAMEHSSVDLILTSIPFSTQYEYSPSFYDFGHSEDNSQFWKQMDFLVPNLYKILAPGRVCVIHVKDRITPSGLTGMGFQTVYPFSDECVRCFTSHGFGFLARKTVVTDVVRENNQTYRLGWTEQCKDGSRMGAGMPEYLLIFRKPATDTSNGYADTPVVKNKADYTRSRWQIDAHGLMRSSGNRMLAPEDLVGVKHERIFKLFRAETSNNVYDYEQHVALSESLERCQECGHIHTGDRKCGICACRIAGSRLPATFMLLQPASWHPDVWTDVARMRTLNMDQSRDGKQMHLCPLQLDICDRIINQFSMPGETVFDPFNGIGTVAVRAIRAGRFGVGCELSAGYWLDSIGYAKAEESKIGQATLFDLLAAEEEPETAEMILKSVM